MHLVHLVIRGRVQGVGFRYFALQEAVRIGVTGMVRNRADGSVEVEAEGERHEIERLVQALRQGPRGARVTSVDESWSEGASRYHAFDIGHGMP